LPKCQARALKNVDEAPYKLLYIFQGSNAISMLHLDKETCFYIWFTREKPRA